MNELVRLELIRESLIAVVNEMRANIIHSSYAPIIYEGHDFSCALMSADGRQVAQGLADHPIHIFAAHDLERRFKKRAGAVFREAVVQQDVDLGGRSLFRRLVGWVLGHVPGQVSNALALTYGRSRLNVQRS